MTGGLSSILLTSLSGLQASQAAMRVTSQNIANVNTPGYVRAVPVFTSTSFGGAASGVNISSVTRAADKFLATASYVAQAAQSSSSIRADLLGRAQSAFGDPTQDTSVFATLDSFWSSITQIGIDPTSALQRNDAVTALQSTFDQISQIGSSIQALISEADQRIADDVSSAQSLMNRIADLNKEIHLTRTTGADSTAAENAQSSAIDDLSKLMDIRVDKDSSGGVTVRTSGGALLVGATASTITYTPNTASFASHGVIQLNPQLGSGSNLEPYLLGGEIKGLLQTRDQDLPQLAEALGGFTGALADALNQVHNENSSTPAVNQLTGRQTGLISSDSLNFTGKSIVGVTDVNGNLVQRLTIDFDAGQITAEPPGSGPFAIGSDIGGLESALNAALGDMGGSATFTGGVLTLKGAANNGLVVQQDATTPSARAGRGFSQFFGLNDLVSQPTPLFFQTGIKSTDAHGFDPSGSLTYQIKDALGRSVGTRTVAVTGSTWDDMITALNTPGSGVGEYGQFALDSSGQLQFTPTAGFQLSLVGDTTDRGGTGVSLSSLMGMSASVTAGRAMGVTVDPEVLADPSRLAVGRPDLTAAIGTQIIELGDNRGAAALAAAKDANRSFPATGSLSAQVTSLTLYAARLGGEAGRIASSAQRDAQSAQAVATAAADRRSQVEGVSLDDELMKMTQYQNAYAASARVIQAATQMFDVLLTLGAT